MKNIIKECWLHAGQGLCMIIAIGMMTMMTACTDDDITENSVPDSTLQLSMKAPGEPERTATRGMITDTWFPTTAIVGLTVMKTSGGTAYDGTGTENIPYQPAAASTTALWHPVTSGADILLSATKATLYGYYPYTGGADITALPMHVAATNAATPDYMWGTPVPNLNDHQPTAAMTMHHALSRVIVRFHKNVYTGNADLSHVGISGAGIATAGTLNTKTGAITVDPSDTHRIDRSIETFRLLTADENNGEEQYYEMEFVIVPTGQNTTLSTHINLDGNGYTVTTAGNYSFVSGKIYTFDIYLKSNTLNYGNVQIEEWGTVEGGGMLIDLGGKVTIKTVPDIAVNCKLSNNDRTLTITAVPMTAGIPVKQPTVTSDAEEGPEHGFNVSMDDTVLDKRTGIRTITIWGVSSNVTVQFNGLDQTESGPDNGLTLPDMTGENF